MSKIGNVKVVPVAWCGTGYDTVKEESADFFAIYEYDNAKGYGEGWFPLYSDNADANDYLYKSKDKAVYAMQDYIAKNSRVWKE